jgi:hypothetical protein
MPFGLKILHANFAKPAPVKAFPNGGKKGYPREVDIFPICALRKTPADAPSHYFFSAPSPQFPVCFRARVRNLATMVLKSKAPSLRSCAELVEGSEARSA